MSSRCLVFVGIVVMMGSSCKTSQTLIDEQYVTTIENYRSTYYQSLTQVENPPIDSLGLESISFFPIDPMYRVEAKFQKKDKTEVIHIPTMDGQYQDFIVVGELAFRLKGQNLKLQAYQAVISRQIPYYKNLLFIPFRDLTAGDETYGGGRYLHINLKEENEVELILDFNKAYNPLCAYSSAYSCPIPPPENNIKAQILAGEKNFDH